MCAFRLPSRAILIASAIVFGLVLVTGFTVRRALAPSILRPIAEAQLSQVLGHPVTVGRLDIDLVPRVQVTGGDITVGGVSAVAAPSLQLRSVRIVPRLASVLSERPAIDLVELDGLALAIRRDARGNWQLPFGSPASPAAPAPGAATPGEPTRPAAAAGEARAGRDTAAPAGPTVDVAAIRLSDGRVTIVDDVLRSPGGSAEVATLKEVQARVSIAGGEVALSELTARLGESALAGSGRVGRGGVRASLAWTMIHPGDLPEIFGLAGTAPVSGLAVQGQRPLEVELTVAPDGTIAAKGTVRADRVAIETLQIEAVEAPFTFDGKRLTADPVGFRAYGGAETGRFVANLGPPAVWSFAGQIDGIDIDAFLSANTSAKGRLKGTGRLAMDVRAPAGPQAIEQRLAGTVNANVTKGVIRDFALVAAINKALRITGGEGTDTAFDELSASLSLAAGRASTDDLVLRMGELRLAAAGWLGLSDQRLDFRGTIILSPAKTAELTHRAGELRNLRNERGEVEIPLVVGGTVSSPAFTVDLDRLLETAAKYQLKRQLEKTLKRLIRR